MDKSPDDLAKGMWQIWNRPGADPRQQFPVARDTLAACGIPYPSPAFDEWMYRNHIRVGDHGRTTLWMRRAEYMGLEVLRTDRKERPEWPPKT